MKQILLVFLFNLIVAVGFAQNGYNCFNCLGEDTGGHGNKVTAVAAAPQLTVYPNPATDFIMLKNAENVQAIRIFNLVGRQVEEFTSVVKGNTYAVANLPNGMYLVQLVDENGDIITTHRMNKR